MFRLGAADVLTARRTVREFTAAPVAPARSAARSRLRSPRRRPHHSEPWRFAVSDGGRPNPAARRHAHGLEG